MKKVRMILSALVVFAVVGSALAFRTKLQRDLWVCQFDNVQNHMICKVPSQAYSSVGPINPVANPGNLYKGQQGQFCDNINDPCKPYPANSPVFINQ